MQQGRNAGLTIAVVGSSTPPGGAIVDRLADTAGRLLAVDAGPVGLLPPQAEVRQVDARDRLLALALDGVDVVVHTAFTGDVSASPDTSFGINVGGTRNVIEACDKAGVSHLVVLSSWMVYGAHHDNPVPLPEEAPARANPMVAAAHHRLLAEHEVLEHADTHPEVTVTVLRVAPLLGAGAEGFIPMRLDGPKLIEPAGSHALWQFAHPSDVAEAVALVVERRAGGIFNVASDGWMTSEEVARARGRTVVQAGQATIETALRVAHDAGFAPAPPEVLPFLLHPVVLQVDALRALGWRPSRTNRQILSEYTDSVGDRVEVGPIRASAGDLRRGAAIVAGLVLLTAWRLRRRLRRR